MGLFDVKTMVVVQSGFPFGKKRKPATDLFSPGEIDVLYPGMLSGMDREQLAVLWKRLSDTSDELYADCDPGMPEWEVWENRMDKLDEMLDRIDEMLKSEEV